MISRPWTKCGLTRPGPFSASTSDSLSIPGRPPMPDPIETPARSLHLVVHVGQAGILDRLAGGVDRVDDERIDLALDLVVDALVGIEAISWSLGFTSPAILAFWSVASKRVIGAIRSCRR